MDGTGTDVTATFFPLLFNNTVHKLERKLLTPYQTFTYQPTLTPFQQVYNLLPPGPPGRYRATREITIPWQTLITLQNAGQRLNYMPHDKARQKWQLEQFLTNNALNTGLPQDYSIFYATPVSPGPASLVLGQGSGGTLVGTFYYVATAVVAGIETVASPEQSITVGGGGAVTATVGTVTGATQYNLYRGAAAGQENVVAVTSAGSPLTDLGAGTPGAPFQAGPGYWYWPTPDKAYLMNVDQLLFFLDLVAAQSPPQTSWFSLTIPDLVLWEMCVQGAIMLGDDAKAKRFTPYRDEAFQTAVAAIAELAMGEQGVPAGMIEPG